tara:strand:- start:68480 stop:70138 length:1659 start_codon:yes stop_codon:yes gene_type:complete
MYRYSANNSITYTSEDFVLFRTSPFACWMERLTLENPDHGIPPDIGSARPTESVVAQDDIAETLSEEGRDVVLIEWDLDESRRRELTQDAMRRGTDFIVNAQLAHGPLSGSANLLMRTSGYSELGNFLYIPCDTQAKTTLNSAFRLCFLADLLHGLQGQLPPQMLIVRSGEDVVPLQTEDHIYHYRAVKQRFMDAMRNFRKHRMPEPAESSHFGRWSDCANEVLRQRALRQPSQALAGVDGADSAESAPQQLEEPRRMAAQGGAGQHEQSSAVAQPDNAKAAAAGDTVAASPVASAQASEAATPPVVSGESVHSPRLNHAMSVNLLKVEARAGQTLAEEALGIPHDSVQTAPADKGALRRIGPTPNLMLATRLSDRRENPEHKRRSSDVALQNLEFIGSSHRAPLIGEQETRELDRRFSDNLSEGHEYDYPAMGLPLEDDLAEEPVLHADTAPPPTLRPHPLDRAGASASSFIDLDTIPTLSAGHNRPGDEAPAAPATGDAAPLDNDDEETPLRPGESPLQLSRTLESLLDEDLHDMTFSSSLMTSDEFDDY